MSTPVSRADKRRWKVVITFLMNERGEFYEMKEIKLKLKPCTEEQAEELVKAEIEKTGWSQWRYSLEEA